MVKFFKFYPYIICLKVDLLQKKASPSGGLDGKACSIKKVNDSRRGAGNEARTRDPNLGKVVLYH